VTPDEDARTLVAEPPPAAEAPAEPAAVAPAEPIVEAAPTACPRCGIPLRPDQEWCLNCGAAARTQIAAPSGWRTPLAIVGAVLAVALAGLVVAFLAISDDADELAGIATAPTAQATPVPGAPAPAPPAQGTPAPTAPTPTPAPPEGEATPVPTITPAPGEEGADPTQTVPPANTDTQPPETTPPSSGAGGATIAKWPAGKSAFTIVLLSSPTKSGARKRAKQLAANGTQVGILHSDDFSSLNSGYWVVFSGQYDSRDAAEDALGGLKGESPSAYVRKVTP
jgi:septal ring-binding cell division protein DamX